MSPSMLSISGYGDVAAMLNRKYQIERALHMAEARLKVLRESEFPEQAQEWAAMRQRMAHSTIGYCRSQLAAMR